MGKLTLYAGYQFIKVSDPSNPLSVGDTTMGGYVFGAVNNTAYLYQDKDLDIEWGGAKYETGPWSFTAAYYRVGQGFYKSAATSTPCSSAAASNCSGVINTVSGIIDYTFNKHFDVYGGVVWSNLVGSFANGYPTTENTAVATGVRLRF
jgi:predicted porin